MPATPAPTPDPAAPTTAAGLFARRVFNPLVAFLTRRGISIWGSRAPEVRGRTSGEPRRAPVNLLTLDDRHYRRPPGRDAMGAQRPGRRPLRHHRRPPAGGVGGPQLDDAAKVPVLRAYLARWRAEVGVFFGGVSASPPTASWPPSPPATPCSPWSRRRVERADEVVAAARRVLERDGRTAHHDRGGRRAGHPGLSLYKHVAGKAAIEVGLIDVAGGDGPGLHGVLRRPGRRPPLVALLDAYRRHALTHPNLYRLATAGRCPGRRSPRAEDWAGEPFLTVTGDAHRLRPCGPRPRHGDPRARRPLPRRLDLDRTWARGAAALAS